MAKTKAKCCGCDLAVPVIRVLFDHFLCCKCVEIARTGSNRIGDQETIEYIPVELDPDDGIQYDDFDYPPVAAHVTHGIQAFTGVRGGFHLQFVEQ